MEKSKKVRDSFFDNYKAFLILCVVVGHFLDYFTDDFRIAEILRIYIYFFHIPAFSFISGYFARKNNFQILIRKLLVPYFIFQIIYYFMYTGMGYEVEFTLLSPFFTLWYLIALFFWRLIINYVETRRFLLPVSIICSVLVGFLPGCSEILSIYRIVAFFPFFVMGHRFQKERFREVTRHRFIAPLSALLLFSLFVFIYRHYNIFEIPILNCQDSYEALGINGNGWFFRLIYILFATCLVLAIGTLMPKSHTPLTFLGKYTMRVYLCHGVVYKYLSKGTDILDIVNGIGDFILYITVVILLAFILSRVPLEPMMDLITSIPKKIVNQLKDHNSHSISHG